jgi:ligand-binding SRPBCC domain-containing protein
VKVHVLRREQLLPHPLERVFSFFAEARNLERITPPLLGFEVVGSEPVEMRAGALIQYRLRLHGLPVDWLTRIDEWEPGVRFVDQQLAGPYRLWHHTHEFEEQGDQTRMRDTVRYAMPMWPLGELAMPLVRRDLQNIFDYRRDSVAPLLAAGDTS